MRRSGLVSACVVSSARCSAAALLAALLLAAAPGASPASAENLAVEAVRDGKFVSVTASARLSADPAVAWQVLTDYDRLAEFIPDMKSSRVVRRDAGRVVVEQKGEFGFVFFRQQLDVTLSISERPPKSIVARAIAGNMKDMEASYELKVSASGLELAYAGRFIPDFFLPPLIGMPLVRRTLERRFRAMVDEIERRGALAREKSPQGKPVTK